MFGICEILSLEIQTISQFYFFRYFFLTVTFILFSFPHPLPVEGHLGIQHVREYDHGVNKI